MMTTGISNETNRRTLLLRGIEQRKLRIEQGSGRFIRFLGGLAVALITSSRVLLGSFENAGTDSPSGEATISASRRRLTTSLPLKLENVNRDNFFSTSHCVAENYELDGWKYRSCQFRNLCFDTQMKEFVLFPSPEEIELEKLIKTRHDKHITISTLMGDSSVSLGTLAPDWSTRQSSLRWFPRIEVDRSLLKERGIYMLPESIVMIPFHSFQAKNPGHLVWDDLFPIYVLMRMFGLEQKQLLLVRQILDEPLKNTCDVNQEDARKCQHNFEHYLPLFNIGSKELFMTSKEFALGGDDSPYVCARFGAAGLGMVANYKLKQSGWSRDDYKLTHTVGWGALLWQFRSFIVGNLLGDGESLWISEKQQQFLTVTFLCLSSSSGLSESAEHIKGLLTLSSVSINSVACDQTKATEQAVILSRTNIMVTDCNGEGMAMASFLPKGASIIRCCFSTTGSTENEASSKVKLDLMSHAGYVRTKWLMTTGPPKGELLELLRSELELNQSYV